MVSCGDTKNHPKLGAQNSHQPHSHLQDFMQGETLTEKDVYNTHEIARHLGDTLAKTNHHGTPKSSRVWSENLRFQPLGFRGSYRRIHAWLVYLKYLPFYRTNQRHSCYGKYYRSSHGILGDSTFLAEFPSSR